MAFICLLVFGLHMERSPHDMFGMPAHFGHVKITARTLDHVPRRDTPLVSTETQAAVIETILDGEDVKTFLERSRKTRGASPTEFDSVNIFKTCMYPDRNSQK